MVVVRPWWNDTEFFYGKHLKNNCVYALISQSGDTTKLLISVISLHSVRLSYTETQTENVHKGK